MNGIGRSKPIIESESAHKAFRFDVMPFPDCVRFDSSPGEISPNAIAKYLSRFPRKLARSDFNSEGRVNLDEARRRNADDVLSRRI